jgi:hypothetical protein
VRLDREVIARIDEIARARSSSWRKVTRSEVLREFACQGIDDAERGIPRRARLTLVQSEDTE